MQVQYMAMSGANEGKDPQHVYVIIVAKYY